MKNVIYIAITVLFSLNCMSSTQAIYWQKLMLEEKVQYRLSNSLGTVLADNQFLVDVEAEVSEPTAPNFGNNKNGETRVSDINLADSRGDYIAFSKVGLEVPVLDKYLDEEKTKLMNLYSFNQAYDIFKYLQGVKVTVYLSETLPAPLQQIAEKVVRSTRLSLGTIKPSMKFEKLALEWIDPAKKIEQKALDEAQKKKEEPTEPKIWTKDWLEWASRWGNAVGLILSALIITFLGLTLFRRWKELLENQKPKESEIQEQKSAEEDEKKEGNENLEEDFMSSDNGVERFKACLSQYPVEASNISREWIATNDEDSKIALRAVAQQLSSDDFAGLLGTLGIEQREAWKSVIGTYLTPIELKEANKIIARDVLKALLVPTKVKDSTLLNLLMELGPFKMTQYLNKNEQHAGILLNLLSPSVTGLILNEVSDSKAEEWLTAAATFDISKTEEAALALKSSLVEFKKSLAPSHFNAKLAELILTAPPAKEKMLFSSISKASGTDEVIKVAQRLFPSELLLRMPDAFVKETLQSYPMAKRLELILSQSEVIRNRLLDCFAETGTPAREMMDMELESISSDAGKVNNIQSRTEDIWREYVSFGRQILQRATEYKPDAEKLIQEWAQGLSKGLKIVNTNAA